MKKRDYKKYKSLMISFAMGAVISAAIYPSKRIVEETRETVETEKQLEIKKLKESHSKETQKLQEQMIKMTQEYKERVEESQNKISTLKEENTSLKISSKNRYYKLIKPDGTIVEKKYSENDSVAVSSVITNIQEEYDRKISSIESKWEKVHKQRVVELRKDFEDRILNARVQIEQEFAERLDSKIEESSLKTLEMTLGYNTGDELGFSASYPVWGPFVIETGIWNTYDIHGFEDFDPTLSIGLGIRF